MRQAAHPLHFEVDLFLLLLFVLLELLFVFELSGLPSLFSFFELFDFLLQGVLALLKGLDLVKVDLFFVEGHRLVELIITALLQLLSLVLHGLLIEEVLRGAAPVAGLPRLIASLTAEALLFWGAHVPPLVLMIACGVVSAILGDEEDRVDLGDGHGGAGVDALI